MPLAGTRVHDERWADHHRPVVSQTRTARCSIRTPGTVSGPINPETGERESTPHEPHYSTPGPNCSVEPLSAAEQEVFAAGQEVTTRGYRVTLDFDAAPDTEVNHLVEIHSVGRNGDPTLAGQTLRVRSMTRGSTVWDRELLCVEDQG